MAISQMKIFKTPLSFTEINALVLKFKSNSRCSEYPKNAEKENIPSTHFDFFTYYKIPVCYYHKNEYMLSVEQKLEIRNTILQLWSTDF